MRDGILLRHRGIGKFESCNEKVRRKLSESTEELNDGSLSTTPHIWVSKFLMSAASAKQEKVIARIIEKFDMPEIDARTLISACADVDQLTKSLSAPISYNVGNHTFNYIEIDVVTWRILPSPENVRFEDSRLGKPNVVRFTAVEDTSFPILKLNVDETASLVRELQLSAAQIAIENPHTKTIPHRGIEVGGWLSLTRAYAKDANRPYGFLDATDGFSRTVGAHNGLGIGAKEVLTVYTNPLEEQKLRKELISLRDKDESGFEISEIDRTRLRSSVMRRARVIVGYKYEKGVAPRSFDKARRTLVGHLHLAPQHSFSAAAKSATKASAISDALFNEDQMPVVSGLSTEKISRILNGELSQWTKAGFFRDQYAVLILDAYRPYLNTRRGRARKRILCLQRHDLGRPAHGGHGPSPSVPRLGRPRRGWRSRDAGWLVNPDAIDSPGFDLPDGPQRQEPRVRSGGGAPHPPPA